MQYAIIVYETAEAHAERENPATAPAYWAAYMAYSKALSDAGVARGGAALQLPITATTLRMRGGKRQVQDGPFADTKEMLGGFFLIEADDLSAAMEWASRCPAAAFGAVEVRPLLPPPPK